MSDPGTLRANSELAAATGAEQRDNPGEIESAGPANEAVAWGEILPDVP